MVLYFQNLMHSDSSTYSASADSEFAHSATSSNSDTSADTKVHQYKRANCQDKRATKKKKLEKQDARTKRRTKRRTKMRRVKEKKLLPINTDCRHYKKNDRCTLHPNYPKEECFNKKYKGRRPRYACKIVGCAYKECICFHSSKGGLTLTDSSSDDNRN